jgi:predicted neuraminidase
MQLMVMQSNDGGQIWLPSKSIADAIAETDYPLLLSNGQGIFVSWNSKTKGYQLIPLN